MTQLNHALHEIHITHNAPQNSSKHKPRHTMEIMIDIRQTLRDCSQLTFSSVSRRVLAVGSTPHHRKWAPNQESEGASTTKPIASSVQLSSAERFDVSRRSPPARNRVHAGPYWMMHNKNRPSVGRQIGRCSRLVRSATFTHNARRSG